MLRSNEIHKLNMLKARMASDIRTAASDLRHLTQLDFETLTIKHNDGHGKSNIHVRDEFMSYATQKDSYNQFQLIDQDGLELLRVKASGGKPYIVPKNELQNVKDNEYFQETIRLNTNEFIHVSSLELNVENGAIERPLKPVLRLAIPVFSRGGNKKGLIAISVLGSKIINYALETAEKGLDNILLMT
ncbi:MAG: hypothetical protein ABIH39_00605, partial [Candidatus Margulisiibacteriota bacterium]